MLSFREMVQRDLHQVVLNLDEHAIEVGYKPLGSAEPITLKAIFGERPSPVEQSRDGQQRFREAELIIQNDATYGITNPVRGDEVVVNGLIWAMSYISSSDDAQHCLILRRPESVNKSPSGAYIPRS